MKDIIHWLVQKSEQHAHHLEADHEMSRQRGSRFRFKEVCDGATMQLACLPCSAAVPIAHRDNPCPVVASPSRRRAGHNPRCLHNACITKCLAYYYFLSGYKYVWEHNLTKGTYNEWVEPRNASGGDVTFTNYQCNTWYCPLYTDRTDRDTTAFAVEGPPERILSGEHRIEVEARLAHDRDLNDNTATCAYEVTGPPPSTTAPFTPAPCLGQQTQMLIPGDTDGGFCPGGNRHTYMLQVPSDLRQLWLQLFFHWGGGHRDFDLIVQPSQSLPANKFECEPEHHASETEQRCFFLDPSPGTYQVHVDRVSGAGTHTLRVQFAYPPPTPTQTATPPPTATRTPTYTATPTKTATPTPPYTDAYAYPRSSRRGTKKVSIIRWNAILDITDRVGGRKRR